MERLDPKLIASTTDRLASEAQINRPWTDTEDPTLKKFLILTEDASLAWLKTESLDMLVAVVLKYRELPR